MLCYLRVVRSLTAKAIEFGSHLVSLQWVRAAATKSPTVPQYQHLRLPWDQYELFIMESIALSDSSASMPERPSPSTSQPFCPRSMLVVCPAEEKSVLFPDTRKCSM